jgi:hypothetical protein
MTLEISSNQKRNIYVVLFTLFGVLFGLFVAGMAEVIYLKLLFKDFVTYSFGLSWEELDQFGQMFGLVLILVSGLWGYASGKFWWKQIYVLKKYRQK